MRKQTLLMKEKVGKLFHSALLMNVVDPREVQIKTSLYTIEATLHVHSLCGYPGLQMKAVTSIECCI